MHKVPYMSHLIQPFLSPSRASENWFYAGLASTYPDITDNLRISEQRLCHGKCISGCRVFHVPSEDVTQAREIAIDDWKDEDAGDVKNQVMVFRYRGTFVAVDHECPHSSYPLSNGTPFDIEDFGVVLSSGIMCSKHDWSFDLHTGRADRGSYKLRVWEVQRRASGDGDSEEEIWVRRKTKIG